MKSSFLKSALILGVIVSIAGCGSASPKAEPDANGNYVVNGSFEEVDFTGWEVVNVDDQTEELDVYARDTDSFEGVQSMHFYSATNKVDFYAEQKIEGLEDGTYKLTAHIQGDTAGDENAAVYFYAIVDGEEVKVDGELNGYVNWYTAELPGIQPTDGEITVGIHVEIAPGGWGTIDDISLVKE
jgi:predicted small lipoprotein YifL